MNELHIAALNEAIVALGLLKSESAPILMPFLSKFLEDHSIKPLKNVLPQVSLQEKKSLGINPKALFSVSMLADLTEKGLKKASFAHEITLQRAAFSIGRASQLKSVSDTTSLFLVRRICPDTAECTNVEEWSEIGNLDYLPPATCNDCARGTCRSSFVFRRKGRLAIP